MSSGVKTTDLEDNRNKSYRSNSLVHSKANMNGKSETIDPQSAEIMTPYAKMHNEEDFDPYNDNMSDEHNISVVEAVEHECDVRRAVIGGVLIVVMGTIIFLVVYYQGFLREQVSNFMETIKEYPISTVFLYFVIMTVLISASVPSAIPQVFGSYVFVHAFGFFKGFWIMVGVDYVSMMIG